MRLEEGLVRLGKIVEERLGLATGLVNLELLKRVAAEETRRTSEALALARILTPDEAFILKVGSKVTVKETYFFRHPEHFEFLNEWLQRQGPSFHAKVVRAWSAGCSTGEEAYSIAACLLANLPSESAGVQVLGTDVEATRIAHAREAWYRSDLPRHGTQFLYPIFDTKRGEAAVVREKLRKITTFREQSLSVDPPDGPFDVIFCRNVFIYFGKEFIRDACARLVSALSPGGLLVLGTVETCELPHGMSRVGPGGLQMFIRTQAGPPPEGPRRAKRQQARRPEARRPASAESQAPAVARSTDAIEAHLRALSSIEKHDLISAHAQLGEIKRHFPNYLPALLEGAMVLDRLGSRERAAQWMKEVISRTAGLIPNLMIEGPTPLPVEYYLTAARAWVASKAKR